MIMPIVVFMLSLLLTMMARGIIRTARDIEEAPLITQASLVICMVTGVLGMIVSLASAVIVATQFLL